MGLEKRIFNIGKNVVVSTALIGMLALGACGKDKNPPVNQAPGITITMDFKKGLSGKVDYEVCGTDDGYVNHIETWENGKYSKHINHERKKLFCVYPSPSIIQGTNTFDVLASDNDGDVSEFLTSDFYSPTEAEGRIAILNAILQNEYSDDGEIEENSSTTGGFFVDYSILRERHSIKAGWIEFVSSKENLTQKLADKQYLDDNSEPNIYLARLPLTEIEMRVDNFIKYFDNCIEPIVVTVLGYNCD